MGYEFDGDDSISRQAAIDVIKTSRCLVNALKKTMKLPSAQPEWKTGHWIFCDESCKCSICGEDPMTFVETTGFNSALMCHEYPMRFCPNCGAKMEVNK